jgi:predicted MPP superfamily phosphohydrolase
MEGVFSPMKLGMIRYLVPLFAAAGVSLLAYSYFIEPNRLVVRPAEIAIRDLDPALDGLRIVLISDIHGGSNGVTFEKLLEVTARANEQRADLILLLGDFVSELPGYRSSTSPLKMETDRIADGLAGLKGKLGVFAVLGNHDGGSGSRVAVELKRVGIRVLEDEIAVVTFNGRELRILGFKDHLEVGHRWKRLPQDTRQLLHGTGDGVIIALQHSPDIMPMITGDNLISPELRLVLAGHTHGGQVWLPILERVIIPSSYGQKYAYGHIRENDVDLFVTGGIGTSILPLRFLVPPEISVLTLRPASDLKP